jgi:hypothetical protein
MEVTELLAVLMTALLVIAAATLAPRRRCLSARTRRSTRRWRTPA